MSLNNFRKTVNNLKIMTSHEHLPIEEERIGVDIDSISFFASSPAHRDDLVCSGISREDISFLTDSKNLMKDRWLRLEPRLEKIKNTGYTKAFKIAMHDIYGVDGLSLESFERLNKKMKEVVKKGFYKHVLHDMAKIDYVINDSHPYFQKMGLGWTWSNEYVFPVIFLTNFVRLFNRGNVEEIGKQTGTKISSLQELTNGINEYLGKIRLKIVGLKFAPSYHRTMKFGNPSPEDAEKSFKEVMKVESPPPGPLPPERGWSEAVILQDYVMNQILKFAEAQNLPVIFHTGIMGGSPFARLENSNPVLLSELFSRYRRVNFVLLHIFPYCEEAGALAKMFSNVFIDMAWFYTLSPSSAKSALLKWMDLLPINKILAFASDDQRVEAIYGTSIIAREIVTRILWERLDSGDLSKDEVIYMAQRLLRDNANEIYLSKIK